VKRINQIEINHVTSEPGDATCYDYIVYNLGDTFKFHSFISTLNYPKELEFWDYQGLFSADINNEEIQQRARALGCNPWTLVECMRTMYEMTNRSKTTHRGITIEGEYV
jgi:hypothetical protein